MDNSSEDESDLLDVDLSDAENYDDEDDITPEEEDEEDTVEDTKLEEEEEEEEEEYAPPPAKKTKQKISTPFTHNSSTHDLFSQYLEVLRAPPFTSLQLKDRMKLCNSQTDSQKTCVMKTIGELIQARGFKIDTSHKLHHFKTVDSIISTNTKGHILLILYANSKVSIQLGREIDQYITNDKIQQIVIVTSEGITPIAKKLLMINKCNVQFFHRLELTVNYTKHKLVPFQKKLEDHEIQVKLKKYNLTKQQLATMNRTDPIVKFYGWKAGSVIQCIKNLGLSMESYETLRLVK